MNYTFRHFAEKDLQSAQTLIKHHISYNVAASLMQQSLEKLIKHILVLKNQEAPRTHFVSFILFIILKIIMWRILL